VAASLSGKGNNVAPVSHRTSSLSALADRWIPKLVLAPSVAISLVFVYGFILITGYLSLSSSRLMRNYTFAGLTRYSELFEKRRLVDVGAKPRLVRHSVHRDLHRAGPVSRHPARSEDSQRRRAARRVPLPDGAFVHRHTHGLAVDSESFVGP
jgi:ABC-type sugar transport system permease subunit